MKRGIAWVTLVAFVSLSGGGKTTGPTGPTSGGTDQVLQQSADAPPGLDIRLSDGKQLAAAYDRSHIAAAAKWADAEATKLLDRMKPIAVDPDDQKDFALRDKSKPPPQTGNIIAGTFPPPPTKSAVPVTNDAGKDLEVLRYQPEGAVPLAPQLSVTFSQAMVAVTSQDDAASTVPVKLTPTPAGKWRWIGTRTLLFDPVVRFPQATTYQVEIPAGTKSATGNELKKAVKFTFETPPPTVVQMYPQDGPTRRDVPMFIAFDQKVDAAEVLKKIEVNANGKKYSVRQLDSSEIEADEQIKAYVEGAKSQDWDGRWIAFRANDEFPTDTAVTVDVKSGTPSAEGPNKTKADQNFYFRTYAPLKIIRA